MRPLPALAFTGGCLALGLFAYDAHRRGGPGDPAPVPPAGAEVHGGPVLGASERERLEARLGALEALVEAQARALRSAAAAPVRGAPVPAPGEAAPSAAAFLRPPPLGPDGRPEVSDAALASLEAHVEEVQRRRKDRHLRGQVAASIDRLALALAPEQRTRLEEAVLAYRRGQETLWEDLKVRGITHPHDQIAESRRRYHAFAEEIRPLVRPAEFDRVMDGLVGRGSLVIPPGAEGSPPGPR